MAPAHSRISSHCRDRERSVKILQAAKDAAFQSRGYNSAVTRQELFKEFKMRNNNMEPYAWQLDVAEALILGVDCSVIAGTGAGKTMPFAMPLFVQSDKIHVIISPLNALEDDQVYYYF